MFATAVLNCAQENDPLSATVVDLRRANGMLTQARLERAIAEGEMRQDAAPVALARFMGAIIQGMTVQARDGSRTDEVVAKADLAAIESARHRAD